jgi:hypothetical protein
MVGRAVHSKFIVADDKWMCVGSANANVRSFELDSELNIQTNAARVVGDFRVQLWAHNLGLTPRTVSSWRIDDFIPRWDAGATSNAPLGSNPQDMAGEGVVAFNYLDHPGSSHFYMPDAFTELDLSPDTGGFGGSGPSGVANPGNPSDGALTDASDPTSPGPAGSAATDTPPATGSPVT